jgi:hypothetical protein
MKKYKEQIKQNEMGRECGMCGKEDWKIWNIEAYA